MITQTINTLTASIKVTSLAAFLVLAVALTGLTTPQNSYAQTVGGIAESFLVTVNKSRVIKMHKEIKKVSMGNPDIADIVILKGSQIYILGKKLGTTNVQLWDSGNNLVKVLDIEVTHDLFQIKKKLHELLPNENIEVFSSSQSVVLRGQVSNVVNMDKAVRVAKSYSIAAQENSENTTGEPVINLLSIGGSQQVMLKVTVAEIDRTTIKELGIKWFASDSSNDWNYGGVAGGANSVSLLPELNIDDIGLFGSLERGDLLFNIALEAAKDDDTAKVLAEPTLTALSGEKAKFLSGGEFPIQVRDSDGISVSFKEFGIAVEFVPVVLSSGSINLKLSVSVSELIGGLVTFDTGEVPSLSLRSTSTTVELADGQSIGLAGLISENTRGNVSKFPGLGDVPILGHLFRSERFEKGETELVIMVTPVLAKPMNVRPNHLPTDSFVEPSDVDFYLLGQIYGKAPVVTVEDDTLTTVSPVMDTDSKSHHPQTDITSNSGGVNNQFGHSVE